MIGHTCPHCGSHLGNTVRVNDQQVANQYETLLAIQRLAAGQNNLVLDQTIRNPGITNEILLTQRSCQTSPPSCY